MFQAYSKEIRLMSHSLSHAWSDSPADASLPQWPHCRLLGPSNQERCQQRVKQLNLLGLLDCDSIAAFEDVTQQVAEFLQLPICVFTVADQTTEYVKAAYGLSYLGLGNALTRLRQISLTEGLGTYVLDSEQPFFVPDTGENPAIAASQLVYTYGIGAYGAVPVISTSGHCIGILAVMDRQPRPFTRQDMGYLAMAARWGMSEYERRTCQATPWTAPQAITPPTPEIRVNQLQSLIDAVRIHLIGQLTQDLCSPLTAVLGMTSLLGQEIYGPLTHKQREYIDIVHHSSKALMEQVEDIVELALFKKEHQTLECAPVDIEMLGQQVVNTLEQLATKRSQTLNISIEPGERLWVLDKSIVKQILYHLVFSVMQMAGENSAIRVHASRKTNSLQLAVWLSNPWLGDGLPQSVVRLCHAMALRPTLGNGLQHLPWPSGQQAEEAPPGQLLSPLQPEDISRELLGLLLSQHLAECHGGHVKLQGSLDAGYRFVVMLPTGSGVEAGHKLAEFTQA